MILKYFILLLFIANSIRLSSQELFGLSDFGAYFEEVSTPTANGLTASLGSSWVYSAKTLDKWGVSFSVTGVLVGIPTDELNFESSTLTEMKDNGYRFISDGVDITDTDFMLPSFASRNKSDILITKAFDPDGNSMIEVPAIDGLNIPTSPNLTFQLALGLPSSTDLILRFSPDIGDVATAYVGVDAVDLTDFYTFGIGLKHDVKQWIPTLQDSRLLDVSVLVAYSRLSFNLSASSEYEDPRAMFPDDIIIINDIYGTSGITAYESQEYDVKGHSIVGSVLLGLDLPYVKPFVGLGVNRAIGIGTSGTYPMLQLDLVEDPRGKTVRVVGLEENPLNIDVARTFFNFQTGIDIEVFFFNIFAQYTFQKYSMFTGGIAIQID